MNKPLIAILCCFFACQKMEKTEEKLPVRWPHAVTYEIFVQSFVDTNGDGIGDLNGVTSKLDYLQDLGIEAIWMMPVNPSPSYHKYDVTDYYGIHPDYGTIEDFKKLIAEAHKRDIKIIMDLVINHSSSDHEWFRSSVEKIGEYRNYYTWANMEQIEAEGTLEKEETGDSGNRRQWNDVEGQDELYFAFFYSGMPDLNYDNPKVREEVYQIGKFWLSEIGIDGFRLDAAKHIYPDHRATDNHAFWKEFYSTMKSYKPDVYTVGEVWADLPTQAPFAEGFSALFNFDLAFTILETVKNERVIGATIFEHAWKLDEDGSPVKLYNSSDSAFKSFNPTFLNTTFLTNHDQNRVMSFLGNDVAKAKLAASILFTLPGAPYIYYGEEIGMMGMKPDELIREPMIWKNGPDPGRTSWIIAEYNTDETIRGVEDQMSDPGSMYHFYRNWIRLRRQEPILTYGSLEPIETGDDQILAFRRTYEGKSLVAYHNLSGVVKSLEMTDAPYWTTNESSTKSLKPYSTIIYSIQ